MRKNLLLVLALFSVICIGAQASMTTPQQTDPETIINGGYSEMTAEGVVISKNRANGNAIEPLYQEKNNRFVRFWQTLYGYIDPAQDQSSERYHHDMHPSPHPMDL